MSILDHTPASLVKADGTGTPVGSLVTYSVTSSAVPVDPRDTSGQIPTFSATVADVAGDPKALVDQDVTLTDWTRTESTGRVVAMDRSASSGMVALDSNTIFERLNTEQTVLPTVLGDGIGNPISQALEQWMLMAGVPRSRIEGNIKMALQSNWIDNYGYIADSISKLRFYGPASNWTSYVPTAQTHLNPIDVNPSQSVVFGGEFQYERTLSELRIHTRVPTDNVDVVYTLRRNGTMWSLWELVGGAENMVFNVNYTPTYENSVFMFVEMKAGPGEGLIDMQIRMMEYDDVNQGTVYSDYFAPELLLPTLRKRPRPFKIDMGWDDTLVVPFGHTNYGAPEMFFMTDTLQAEYPQWNYSISTDSAESHKWPYKIPGFTGNVWDKIREFCSLVEVDIAFKSDRIVFQSRSKAQTDLSGDFIPALVMGKGGLRESVSKRETSRSVEVLLREMEGNENNYGNNLLWKADSVYTIEKGERKEEVVQTDSSFVFLNQPVPVSGVPVPYTSAFGSYVITGNDGYIVDPQWWKDNGGSITVEQTGVSGEIKLVMQAPTVDTVRAPYRVSEGVADRPALYILGKGLKLKAPKTMKFFTGAPLSAQDVGVTFDSPFVTSSLLATNTGHKLAVAYGTTNSDISFDVSQAEVSEPEDSNAPLTPINGHVYWGGSYYRIGEQTVSPGSVQVSGAPRHNTIAALNGEFATGKTIADWNSLHAGKLIRDTNIAPLPRYVS